MMDIQNIQIGTQSAELYKIRKQTEEQKLEQSPQVNSEQLQKVDEYDKNNPIGEDVEGLYSVSHDEEGNLKVDYKQPASKADIKNEGIAASSTNESEEDEELEKLKEQRDAIKQNLNRETDESVKAQLRVQLQSIEMQIALKSSGKQEE